MSKKILIFLLPSWIGSFLLSLPHIWCSHALAGWQTGCFCLFEQLMDWLAGLLWKLVACQYHTRFLCLTIYLHQWVVFFLFIPFLHSSRFLSWIYVWHRTKKAPFCHALFLTSVLVISYTFSLCVVVPFGSVMTFPICWCWDHLEC